MATFYASETRTVQIEFHFSHTHVCTEVWVGEAVTQEEGVTCRIRNLGLNTCWAPTVCGPGNGPGLPEPWVLI